MQRPGGLKGLGLREGDELGLAPAQGMCRGSARRWRQSEHTVCQARTLTFDLCPRPVRAGKVSKPGGHSEFFILSLHPACSPLLVGVISTRTDASTRTRTTFPLLLGKAPNLTRASKAPPGPADRSHLYSTEPMPYLCLLLTSEPLHLEGPFLPSSPGGSLLTWQISPHHCPLGEQLSSPHPRPRSGAHARCSDPCACPWSKH